MAFHTTSAMKGTRSIKCSNVDGTDAQCLEIEDTPSLTGSPEHLCEVVEHGRGEGCFPNMDVLIKFRHFLPLVWR